MKQLEQLTQWVSVVVAEPAVHDVLAVDEQSVILTPLTGDAGFRRYYRTNTIPESLLVDAPPNSGKSESACAGASNER